MIEPDALRHTTYRVDDRVAVISLDRADKANSVTQRTLDELDACFDAAVRDTAVRVIVLRAEGKHFSAGHDMTGGADEPDGHGVELQARMAERGLEALYEWESVHYLGYSRKWRDLPKPTIAAVQGQCIAGGLMLCWPCDLIVAADDAMFSDPVVRMGIGGVEYHAHTWELGARKAKEMLFTARRFTAAEAEAAGMVNRVVPRAELDDATLTLAREIAQMHPFALRQAKRVVNQTVDAQGFYTALQACFDVHSIGHGNAMTVSGIPVLLDLEGMKDPGAKAPGA